MLELEYVTNSSTNDDSASSSNQFKLIRLSRLPRLYKLLRILRLFKLLRLLKSNKTLKKVFDLINMNVGIVKMVTVTISVFFLIHLIGCLWFLFAKLDDFDPNTWVIRYNYLDKDPST